MGLFWKSKAEKEQETQLKQQEHRRKEEEILESNKQIIQNFIQIGVNAITSFGMSDDEKIDIVTKIEGSLLENNGYNLSDQKTIVTKACEKIKNEYSEFSTKIDELEPELLQNIDTTGSIDVVKFNELIFEINWKYNVTPEVAEQILKNARKNENPLGPDAYKKVMAKISEKYENELLIELDSIAAADIEFWRMRTKDSGKVISNKVYAKSKAIEQGLKWLSDDEYQP